MEVDAFVPFLPWNVPLFDELWGEEMFVKGNLIIKEEPLPCCCIDSRFRVVVARS